MRFDDRLLTVLNQPAEDRHDAAVRWRQLVDLVARAGANSPSPVLDQALEAINTEAPNVEEPLRAAAARAVAALPLPLGLLEHFATDTLAVAAPVLAAAALDQRQWRALRSLANDETRAFIDTLHPDPEFEPVQSRDGSLSEFGSPEPPSPAPPPDYTPPSLHEVVERIEQRRRMRSGRPANAGDATAGEAASLFRWECRPTGEIAWVEGAPRGALIGRSIARPIESAGDRVDQEVARAFAMRAPFRDATMTISAAGGASGEWKISGVPAFEPADGRFVGYRGVALREIGQPPVPSAAQPPTELIADPDSLRELVHEIKTPLNAIIGFAEIIEGQYLGPADRGYRERAGEIVRQARLLLTAIDDLDFAAKIHSAGGARERVDLAALVAREVSELRELGRGRGVGLDIGTPRSEAPALVRRELAERLVVRLAAALADLARSGERLQLHAELTADSARMSVTRPAALLGMSQSELFEGRPGTSGAKGAFMLRLVRGLARIAGGDLIAARDSLALVFPRF